MGFVEDYREEFLLLSAAFIHLIDDGSIQTFAEMRDQGCIKWSFLLKSGKADEVSHKNLASGGPCMCEHNEQQMVIRVNFPAIRWKTEFE